MIDELLKRIARLLGVRSLVTLMLTAGMLCLLSGVWNPNETVIALYSTSYGAVMTYFFTREEKESANNKE